MLILKFAFWSESYWAFRETDSCLVSYHVKQFIYCVFRQKLKKNWWRSMLIILWVFLLIVSLYFNKSSVIWNIENNLHNVLLLFTCNIFYYYITTNEIPGELSRENMISSHMKITCYLHMLKDHHCYGYVINRCFHREKLLKWNGLVFHIINRTLHGHLELWNFSSRVEKYFTRERLFTTWREILHICMAMYM